MNADRRRFVSATGAALGSLAVAGCAGNSDGSGDGDDASGGTGSDGAAGNPSGGGNVSVDARKEFVALEGEAGETPAYLKPRSFSAYETESAVGVFGLVENVGEQPVADLRVKVTLHDAGTELGEAVDWADEQIGVLRPARTWRFNATIDDKQTTEASGFSVSASGEVVEDLGDGTADDGPNQTA